MGLISYLLNLGRPARKDNPAMYGLRELVCGKSTEAGPLWDAIDNLGGTLDSLIAEFPKPLGKSDAVSNLFGPFIVRSIVDVSMAALIGPIDPFRLLTDTPRSAIER